MRTKTNRPPKTFLHSDMLFEVFYALDKEVSLSDVRRVVNGFVDTLRVNLAHGDISVIKNLGTFSTRLYAERAYVFHGKRTVIRERRYPVFQPTHELRKHVRQDGGSLLKSK